MNLTARLLFCPALALFSVFSLVANDVRAEALDVSIEGAFWTSSTRGGGYRALLGVSIGFERLLFPPRAMPVTDDSEDANGDADALAESASEREPTPSSEGDVPADAAHVEQAPSGTDNAEAQAAVDALLTARPFWLTAAFARELLLAVQAHHQGEQRDEYLLSLGSRSRTAAVLPVLRLRAGRSADQTLRFSPTTDDPNRWLQAGGADLRYEAQATWTLDRLIFSGDEIAIERIRVQLEREREQRAEEALKLLLRWQSARLRALDPGLDPERRVAAQIEEIQSEIELDALSGGWFSERLRASRPS